MFMYSGSGVGGGWDCTIVSDCSWFWLWRYTVGDGDGSVVGSWWSMAAGGDGRLVG